MSVFSSSVAALLVVAALALILKNFGFKGTPVLVAVAAVFTISVFEGSLFALRDVYSEISSYEEIGEYSSAAMKVVGIGYLCGISSDICKEIGEAGVAKCIALISKLELIAIAAPFLSDVLAVCVELLGG